MKGEEGELESDSAKKEEGGNPEQGIHRAFGDGLGDGVKAHAARKSIQVTESEQFKCRGDASHQNVFGAGFGALRIGLVPRGERIHRERGEFESQKEREQFVCGYDDEPSKGGGGDGGGKFRKLVQLGLSVGRVVKVVFGKKQGEQRAQHKDFPHENAKAVDFPVGKESLRSPDQKRVEQNENAAEKQNGKDERQLAFFRKEQMQRDDGKRKKQKQNIG